MGSRPLRFLPPSITKRGCALLHAQCWLWGHDVRRAEGNLLLEQGFERVRAPKNVCGCSQYTLVLEDGLQLRLWGFGLFLGRPRGDAFEGLYVNRYAFTPWYSTLRGDVWEAHRFKRLPRSTDWPLLARALRWVEMYEQNVQSAVGPQYREQCLRGWQDHQLTAPSLRQGWIELERRVARLPCGPVQTVTA